MGLFDLFKKKSSGDVAKDRLKLLLVSDRANCSPEVMEMIKNDIIKKIFITAILFFLLAAFNEYSNSAQNIDDLSLLIIFF